ncbi:hypothetical protein [Streptomyces longispororuber]|nr:hypothetical protein [Streptomyces longispororuber]
MPTCPTATQLPQAPLRGTGSAKETTQRTASTKSSSKQRARNQLSW